MADKQQTFQGILEEMKGMSLEEMYEEALRLKEEQGSEWDPVDEEILEKLRLLIKGEFVPEALDEEDWGQDFEEDWSEDVPEESSEENSEEPVLAYKRKVQRQKSHSRMTRLKRWLAQGLLGRLKARKKAKKYRRRLKTQLKTTRKINKYKLRTRIGPKVKSRHRKASEGLTHLDLVRLERHGYVSEDSE